MDGSNEAPNDIENQYNPELGTLMRKELNSLPIRSSLRCIYRVPERLRKGNEEAYTPQVVSIGPLYRGKPHLNAMEEHKKRYLQDFLGRCTEVSLDAYINIIRVKEVSLRNCYAEDIEFESDDFVRIVLVDAAFIIEFLFKLYTQYQDEKDYIFDQPWMANDVFPDMQMLENQLPFFILQDIFEANTYFSTYPGFSIVEVSYLVCKSAISDLDGQEDASEGKCVSEVEVKHFVDLIRILSLPLKPKPGGIIKTASTPSITELHQAGIKFKVGETRNFFDIRFANGILEIPKLHIEIHTEVTIRNLLAFEQCHCKEKYICNYVIVMDRFVNTLKDVEYLVKCGIVENEIGDNSKVLNLINNIESGVRVDYNDFYFAELLQDLNKHCGTPWNKWKANLRQNYLNTPWAIISVIAAVLLLMLTLIQTVSSVISIA